MRISKSIETLIPTMPATNTPSEPSLKEGTFEYIEAKIRRDAEGTMFGTDFEWLCQWLLKHAPRYRGQFDKVWLWKDWPERWGADAGIDLVARTRTGELWAIQAKADHPDRAITKREIDSFLSESNRSQFAYRLLMATTDDIGATARRTLHGQEKPVGLVLRGHFLTEEVQWPVQIGGTAAPLPRWTARPHQATAIKAVVNGFQDHDRGRLIMACGTGKTLTALWIAERLQSSLTLVLVPSLSLVQQNLAEWGRHSAQDFDTLVVCSDESVLQSQTDAAIQSTADLGVQVTTDPAEIRRFLSKRRTRPAVVFATYQSSVRIAAAQSGNRKKFDLAICDEAHRLAGHAEGLFATVLDDQKIQARKRLFMTATPRYIKDHVKRRAAELEFELVSMDDDHVFGPEFHVLNFHEAISADPPLLTDYQVVVIGVTDREAKAWAEEALLVRTAEGLSTEARTLAAQIGLAKAMKKYNLRRIITFHSSVAKAARFVDPTLTDSLPGVIPHLTRSARPTGILWTKHISGHTPAGQRATLLKGLGNLPDGTRGILSNCACLGEGVDVPVLDGVAFIDPKRSMVDIIQAVGRVIRKAAGKQLGTIVIPVFIDESEDADHVLSQSAFEPVWQVLKALRAHDRRLADELDQLRLSLGKRSKASGRISLPDNIHLDVPRLLLRDFEQAFYVRTVEQTTDRPPLTIEQILAWADAHKAATGNWPKHVSGTICNTVETWSAVHSALYEGRRGFLGGSSLARVLDEHRGVRNHRALQPLSIDLILTWADAHKATSGNWPSQKSGRVCDTGETWAGLSSTLLRGGRGLPGGSTLANLLAEYRGVRNHMDLPPLTIQQILAWSDEHKKTTGCWPGKTSGQIVGTDEKWDGINAALRIGRRGLPGGSSLAVLLAEHRNVRNLQNLPPLTIKRILGWADAYYSTKSEWPIKSSGQVADAAETWSGIDSALRAGVRGLSGNSSLAILLAKHRGVRNRKTLPPLTTAQILEMADQHKVATGKWPNQKSGEVPDTGDNWAVIDAALARGLRGLPGGSSLARLLAEHREVRNNLDLASLTNEQILAWADSYEDVNGHWPRMNSGQVPGTDETWAKLDSALRAGSRGMLGGSSLPRLLSQHRGVRNMKSLQPLTIELILQWADAYRSATGKRPSQSSGGIVGTEETWLKIDAALRKGLRGLPSGLSLAKLLDSPREN
jgi:superfamily II DNA or RNA helicase